MHDIILTQTIPNKRVSHTNALVNTSIKEVFASNVASSGYIFSSNIHSPLSYTLQYFKNLSFNQKCFFIDNHTKALPLLIAQIIKELKNDRY